MTKEELEKLAEELASIWYDNTGNADDAWESVARHVAKMVISARLEELDREDISRELRLHWKGQEIVDNRIEELTNELKSLGEI